MCSVAQSITGIFNKPGEFLKGDLTHRIMLAQNFLFLWQIILPSCKTYCDSYGWFWQDIGVILTSHRGDSDKQRQAENQMLGMDTKAHSYKHSPCISVSRTHLVSGHSASLLYFMMYLGGKQSSATALAINLPMTCRKVHPHVTHISFVFHDVRGWRAVNRQQLLR